MCDVTWRFGVLTESVIGRYVVHTNQRRDGFRSESGYPTQGICDQGIQYLTKETATAHNEQFGTGRGGGQGRDLHSMTRMGEGQRLLDM